MIKNIMFSVNAAVGFASLIAVLTNIIMGSFGWAWIWLAPTVYAAGNLFAIEEERQKNETE